MQAGAVFGVCRRAIGAPSICSTTFFDGVTCDYGSGWHGREYLGSRMWRWSSGSAVLNIHNPTPGALRVNVDFEVMAQTARTVTLHILDARQVLSLDPHRRTRIHFDAIELPPGDCLLALDTTEPPWIEPGPHGRPLAFLLQNMQITGHPSRVMFSARVPSLTKANCGLRRKRVRAPDAPSRQTVQDDERLVARADELENGAMAILFEHEAGDGEYGQRQPQTHRAGFRPDRGEPYPYCAVQEKVVSLPLGELGSLAPVPVMDFPSGLTVPTKSALRPIVLPPTSTVVITTLDPLIVPLTLLVL